MRITAAEQQETELVNLEAAVRAHDERTRDVARTKPQPISTAADTARGEAAPGTSLE